MAEVKVPVGERPEVTQLKTLRDLTQRTGLLHDLQAHQLKLWPLAILNAASSTAVFNFDTKTVRFNLTSFVGTEPGNLNDRIEHLKKCVHYLLGGSYGVSVYLGRKRIDARPQSRKKTGRKRTKDAE